MRLFYSATSPYSRKVRVVMAEKGLADRIEPALCNPFEDVAELIPANPLCKVPALELDDGVVLYDSPVICEYLDSLDGPDNAARLIPAEGPDRWAVLRRQALADGILDAAFNTVVELRRPEAEQSQHWLGRWRGAIERGLDVVETEIGSLPADMTLAHIAIGCALGYLDFRLPDLNDRSTHPSTDQWFAALSQRPSMALSQHEG